MSKSRLKNAVSIDTVEMATQEMVDEVYLPWLKQIKKLRRAKDGTVLQRDAVIELCTLSHISEIKGKVLVRLLEEYLEAHPDDEND